MGSSPGAAAGIPPDPSGPARTRNSSNSDKPVDNLRREWRHGEEDGGGQAAIAHLQGQDYTLYEDWCQVPPSPNHRPSERDVSVIEYLI